VSERKRLTINADGALTQKLDTYLKVQQAYATAIGQHQGSWVPSVVMGGSGGGSSASNSGAMQLMEMFAVKAAKDLSLDMSIPAGRAVAAR